MKKMLPLLPRATATCSGVILWTDVNLSMSINNGEGIYGNIGHKKR
jgi:hypothetical protein